MEPEDLLLALIHLAKIKSIPIDEEEFLSLIETAVETSGALMCRV